MSCNYAEGLSPYENKGVLGLPETLDSVEKLEIKCKNLANLIKSSKHVVIHTGAGISTSAGIPDFRGPNGVWTLEREGKKPKISIEFSEAKPTITHMAIKELVEKDLVHYVVSQNIDGLHLKSGLNRDNLAELHGNMFVDECNLCSRIFVRSNPVSTVGKKTSGQPCISSKVSGRSCRGKLHDSILDWEHSLPENDLLMAEMHSSIADLSICLGTTLQIVPSGNLPLETLKYGGKLAICNLQPTKHDNKADLKVNYYVDDVMERVLKHLNLSIPKYNHLDDPTRYATQDNPIEWTILRTTLNEVEKRFKSKCKGVKKRRILIKTKNDAKKCKTIYVSKNTCNSPSEREIKQTSDDPDKLDLSIQCSNNYASENNCKIPRESNFKQEIDMRDLNKLTSGISEDKMKQELNISGKLENESEIKFSTNLKSEIDLKIPHQHEIMDEIIKSEEILEV